MSVELTDEERLVLDGRFRAAEIAEKLAGAYWADSKREFLIQMARAELFKLADVFGFELVARPPVERKEAAE